MLLQRSRLAATTVERPRLAPPWSIALLGAMVALALIVIYPHQALVRRILAAQPGEVTNAYLVNLLRTDPRNPGLRLFLARSQIAAHQYDQVARTVAPALASNDPAQRNEALWILWQSEEHRYVRLPENTPRRADILAGLRRQLHALADLDWPEELLTELARKAFALGDAELGLRLFKRLANASAEHDEFWFAEAGRVALAQGEYLAAAEFHLIASRRSVLPSLRRQHFLDAMSALESGNRLPDALRLAGEALTQTPELAKETEILVVLVRFARAARRPDLADHYARLLLRLSLETQWRRAALAARGFDAQVRTVATVPDTSRGEPQLPFDDRIYTLGFEAFLDNRKLDDAWKVAASAVRQAPDNLPWRERLAQISEWTGRPQQALAHWLVVAQVSGREEAWDAVLRLAPGLFDDAALRLALEHRLTRQPDNEALLREVVAVYERLGQPQAGLKFLEQTFRRTGKVWVLSAAAELAERAGDDELALRYWKRSFASGGMTTASAVRAATLLLVRGQAEAGLSILEQAQAAAPATDTAFWRLTAELAQLTAQDERSIAAYRRFVDGGEALVRDYDALYTLLQDRYPHEAARIATQAWSRFGEPRHLRLALSYHAASENWHAMGELLAGIAPERLAELRQQADFLQWSARYRLNQGQPEAARRDLQAALTIAPDSSEIQQALLWLLIDSGDGQALRRVLASREDAWSADPRLHDALAASYLALSLPDVALRRYLTPHLGEHRDDFLWLMTYADALEQNHDVDRAWQLRQHLLAQSRSTVGARPQLSGDPPELAEVRRAARARLVLAQTKGDPGLAVLRELLRLDRDAKRTLSPAAKDIVLGWLQDAGEHSAVRAWLWQQYAKTASRPLWAEISLALAENDRETAGQLLDRHGDRLPRGDRISAASQMRDLRRAQSEAFDSQSAQENDDELQLQLTDALLEHSDHVGGEVVRRDLGTLDERETAARWHVAISPVLSLDLALGNIARNPSGNDASGFVPDETYRSARLVWRQPGGETRFTAEARRSFDHYQPLLLEHEQRIDDRLSLSAAFGWQQPARESIPLRIAGMNDLARIGARYRPTLRDQIQVEHHWNRYEAQTGTSLGTGRVWQVEAAHALRLDPRNLEASVFWSSHRYDPRAEISDIRLQRLLPAGITFSDLGPNYFLPDAFRFYGIRVSTDTRFEKDYTRAWRPYATAARTWHSELGPGYDLGIGLAGSVFGNDHLAFGWRLSKSGATSGGTVREFGLTYRLHY